MLDKNDNKTKCADGRTIAAFDIPCSRPSSKVHALQRSLLDMYPQCLQVATQRNKIISFMGRVEGKCTYAVPSASCGSRPSPRMPLQSG